MRGPVDYIIVGFPGNKFKGEILKELTAATKSGAIAVLDLAVILRDDKGDVTKLEISDPAITGLLPDGSPGLISDEDVAEVGDVLDDNCAAGLLIVEQLWAKGLKKAILDAEGVLLAEGRIHPEAAQELEA